MAILTREEADFSEKRVIDLEGSDGNAFALLSYARQYGKQLGFDVNAISVEMKQGDYKHLYTTFDKYFGDYFDLILPD